MISSSVLHKDSLAPQRCGSENVISIYIYIYYRLSSWGLLMKLLSGECSWTPLMIAQYWCSLWLGVVRQQPITWANFDPDLCCHMGEPGHNTLRVHQHLNKLLINIYMISVMRSAEVHLPNINIDQHSLYVYINIFKTFDTNSFDLDDFIIHMHLTSFLSLWISYIFNANISCADHCLKLADSGPLLLADIDEMGIQYKIWISNHTQIKEWDVITFFC